MFFSSSGLGYMVGSCVSQLFGHWRWGLRVTPALNLAAIVAMGIFMEDPERGESDSKCHHHKNPSSKSAYVADLSYLFRNKTFMLTTLGFTSLTFFTGAISW